MSSTARPDGFDVSADWFRRDKVECVTIWCSPVPASIVCWCRIVKLGIAEIVSFLSNFDDSVSSKLASLNTRLDSLEASLS